MVTTSRAISAARLVAADAGSWACSTTRESLRLPVARKPVLSGRMVGGRESFQLGRDLRGRTRQ
jgi:hypothetical protein